MELIIGILGLIFVLAAFLFDEFSKVNRDTVAYNLMNIFGSGLLAFYAFALKGWPFLFLNVIWFIAAVIKLVIMLRK